MTDTIDEKSWETLCKQCGRCCLEKLEDGRGKIIYTREACQYLDRVTLRCMIYERRTEINPLCVQLTPELVPELHWLPPDCGYRPAPARFTRKSSRKRKKRNSER